MAADSVSQREITRRQLLAGGAGAVGGLIIGGIAGSALAPKSSGGSGGGSRGNLKVVGIYPTGGVIASDGKEMANGVKMAVDEINTRGAGEDLPSGHLALSDRCCRFGFGRHF